MRRLATCLFFATFACVWFWGGALWTGTGVSASAGREGRIVAIGDVHGADVEFASMLERAGLIDKSRKWIGGRTILVQTGDMTDRGTGMRAALDLLMALEQQAPKSGGRVHALLGNHEVMNMVGEMRDATPEIFATFGGEASMREAFGPRGRYGRWLRRKRVVTSLSGTVFMHAGINPEFTQDSLEDVNRRVQREIQQWDDGVKLLVEQKLVSPAPAFLEAVTAARTEIERINAAVAEGNVPDDAVRIATLLLPVANIGTSSLFHPDGPLWFRGYATWSEAEGAPRVAELLKRYQASRFVTGHTVQPEGRIGERFNRTFFLIDTGMLGGRYFPGGRPSALELTGETARPIYLQ